MKMFLNHTKLPAEDKSNITLLFCKLPNYIESLDIFMNSRKFL